MTNDKRKRYDLIFIAFFLIVGMLLGRMVIERYRTDVHDKVEEIISKVVMVDVPPVDRAIGKYLSENTYPYKYITAIDTFDNTYGIYEVKDNDVAAYAHGKCVSTGEAIPGVYEIEGTKSHIDYHDTRYWRVVDLRSTDGIGTEDEGEITLSVSSSGYEIDDAPIVKKDSVGFGNIMIDSEVMLTVYDNSEPGIILIVIDSGEKNGKND